MIFYFPETLLFMKMLVLITHVRNTEERKKVLLRV